MGLDMYIVKKTVAEGHTVREVEELNELVQFVNNYEALTKDVKNNGENLNPNKYWTILGESEEEKRSRLLQEIPHFLSEMKEEYDAAMKKLTVENIELATTFYTEEVAYWRKANHIHKWFVDNVQNGVDDCEYHLLTFDKLKELLETCRNVIAISENDDLDDVEQRYEALLPTQVGFFFGSTGYDSYYLDSIHNTINQLEPLLELKLAPHEELYYIASW